MYWYNDVLDAIRLQKQITEGLNQLDRGEHYTTEEIKEIMKIHKSGLIT